MDILEMETNILTFLWQKQMNINKLQTNQQNLFMIIVKI